MKTIAALLVTVFAITACNAEKAVAPVNAEKQLAEKVYQDLRMVDAAVDQYAIEYCKAGGSSVAAKDIAVYFHDGTPLQESCLKGECLDSAGNEIGIPLIDSFPKVPDSTVKRFQNVVPKEFWSPYLHD